MGHCKATKRAAGASKVETYYWRPTKTLLMSVPRRRKTIKRGEIQRFPFAFSLHHQFAQVVFSAANVGIKPSRRQNVSRSATVSAAVNGVVRSRISKLPPAARLEASDAMAMHCAGL